MRKDPIGQLKAADSATASEDRGYLYDTGHVGQLILRVHGERRHRGELDTPTNAVAVPRDFALVQRLGLLTLSGEESSTYISLNIPHHARHRVLSWLTRDVVGSSSLSTPVSSSVRDATAPAMLLRAYTAQKKLAPGNR